jgi:deoxycytidylate deaminase
MHNILDKLYLQASRSLIEHQLSAVILKGTRMISKPLCNTERNTFRGNSCGSLHAEANAIVNYFGNSLIFTKKGWCFIPPKWKEKIKLKPPGC